MKQPILQVDAFTCEPFRGNPAAVCILDQPREEGWMQNIALEMNLSETAFLFPENGGFRLRWFTPACEVDLCGHATLASAHVLWETGILPRDGEACFFTRSGRLTAVWENGWIQLNFPAQPAQSADCPESLAEALGVTPRDVKKNRMDYLIAVDSETMVREIKPDWMRLASLPMRGVMVTAPAKEYDFVSRFFAPAVGVNEDPVTGSAHCCLGPYWAERLGKARLSAFQVSARGGEVNVEISGDRVILGGQAVTVLRGELEL